MNATKAMTQFRSVAYTARPARRRLGVPHAVAVVAAFAFVSALVIGAI